MRSRATNNGRCNNLQSQSINGHFSNRSSNPGQIFVKHLPSNITKNDLWTYFSQFGRVVDSIVVNAIQRKKTAHNYGFVTFADPAVVDELTDYTRSKTKRLHEINGALVRVNRAFPVNVGGHLSIAGLHCSTFVAPSHNRFRRYHHHMSDMRSERSPESSVPSWGNHQHNLRHLHREETVAAAHRLWRKGKRGHKSKFQMVG